ncbi:Site-specific recombinase XerD [Pseudoxanthomonas sp. CF125]|nr:Site-specific recombinase XerD [Pseudoxanthomonas sp. CF125]
MSDLVALTALEPTTERYLAACWSDSTRRAYAGDLRDFLKWGGCLPASEQQVVEYINERAKVFRVRTLERRLTGIGMAHALQGHTDPTKSTLIKKLMRGVKRVHGVTPRQAQPILHADLQQMFERTVGLTQTRDRALLMLGFSCAFRRSEVVSLNVEDLSFTEAGLTVRLRRSKNDQYGKTRLIGVPHGTGDACTVLAVRAWLYASGIRSGPLFRRLLKSKRSGARLSDQSVSLIIKRYAVAVGLPVDRISGHSLRAGFVTSAVRAGASLVSIQRQTGHASLDMLARYIRELDPFILNAHDHLR